MMTLVVLLGCREQTLAERAAGNYSGRYFKNVLTFQVSRDGTFRQVGPFSPGESLPVPQPFEARGDTMVVSLDGRHTMSVLYLGDSLSMTLNRTTPWILYRERPGRGTSNRRAPANPTLASAARDTTLYSDFQVDVQVEAMPPVAGPSFLDAWRSQLTSDDVLAQWVVDTLGSAELETLTVCCSKHGWVSDSIRAALRQTRFRPAEKDGRKVRQRYRRALTPQRG